MANPVLNIAETTYVMTFEFAKFSASDASMTSAKLGTSIQAPETPKTAYPQHISNKLFGNSRDGPDTKLPTPNTKSDPMMISLFSIIFGTY